MIFLNFLNSAPATRGLVKKSATIYLVVKGNIQCVPLQIWPYQLCRRIWFQCAFLCVWCMKAFRCFPCRWRLRCLGRECCRLCSSIMPLQKISTILVPMGVVHQTPQVLLLWSFGWSYFAKWRYQPLFLVVLLGACGDLCFSSCHYVVLQILHPHTSIYFLFHWIQGWMEGVGSIGDIS